MRKGKVKENLQLRLPASQNVLRQWEAGNPRMEHQNWWLLESAKDFLVAFLRVMAELTIVHFYIMQVHCPPNATAHKLELPNLVS
jgi:hypothetical protein